MEGSMYRKASSSFWRFWGAISGAILVSVLLSAPAIAVARSAPALDTARYYLMEVEGTNPASFLGPVRQEGGLVLGYQPGDSYVVRTTSHGASILREATGVRSVVPYPSSLKIDPKLAGRGGRVAVVVVSFPDPTVSVQDIADEIARRGAAVTRVTPENYQVFASVEARSLPDIALIPEVQWIQAQGTPGYDMDNVRAYTGAEYVHVNGYDGTGVVGEVMDNGIDQTHQEFVSRVRATDCPNPPCPVMNHGTSTFAIAFARGASPRAEGMLSGIHPGPPVPNGVFALDPISGGYSRTLAAQHLVQNWGGVFQSHSWGMGPIDQTYDALSAENDQIVFDRDITMTQSMGNFLFFDGNHARTEAMAKNIIAVGGICHEDNTDRTDDSWNCPGKVGGVGPASDGRLKPDLSGPFDFVYTACALYDPGHPSDCPQGQKYLETFGGTSAAAPVVAGASGLVYQMYRANVFRNNPTGKTPHASTVKALLIANAYQFNLATQATRCEQGWGTPDLAFMYDRRATHTIIDGDVLLRQGQPAMTYLFDSQSPSPLKITLAWTDPPASPPYTSPHLVNDLDLFAIDPMGNFYWGNYGLIGDTTQPFCPGGSQWSVPSGGPLAYGARDSKNNVENIFVQSPAWGRWLITVRAHSLAMDGYPQTPGIIDQPFSLVVSAGPPIVDAVRPDQTILQYPFCGDTTTSERPSFTWTPMSDPIPSSGLKWYEFELGTSATFSESSIVFRARPRDYSLTSPYLSPGHYFWRVRAVDGAGNAGVWSTPSACDLTVAVINVSPPGGLTASRLGPSTVHLSWNPVIGADRYRVYDTRNQYPGYPSWNLLGETTGTSFDAGHLTDGLTHYYIVRTVQGASESRASSMGVKVQLSIEFDPLQTNIDYFSLPYRSEFTKASDVSNYLTSTKIDVVSKWNPATQSSVLWLFFRGAWTGTDFPISPGDGLWIGSTAAFSWPIVGGDQSSTLMFVHNSPPTENVNWVGLPYTSVYTRASDIVYDLEGGLGPTANTRIIDVSKWYAGVQTLATYSWSPGGWFGTDFGLLPGEAVRITIASTFAWQPRLVTPEVP